MLLHLYSSPHLKLVSYSVLLTFLFRSLSSCLTISHSSFMSDHHDPDPSQIAFGTAVRSSTTATRSDDAVSARSAACEKLVDEAIENDWGATMLGDNLKVLGLKAIEAYDYIQEYAQRMDIRRAKARQPDSPPREQCDHSADAELDHTQDHEDRDKAVEEASWASLRAKLESADATNTSTTSGVLDKVLELLGQEVPSSTNLSKSVLAVAPHLANNDHTVFEDSHLSETQKCKLAYASQKPFENLIIRAQGRKVREPIANSIWKLVILDKYVDFEKLYVTLDPGYNPNDEAKELNDKFSLLEKNSISSKRPILSEAEWMRLYDVWVDAVLHFYTHRRAELSSYRDLIVNMFRAAPSPLPAIKFDRDSRERYSRQPCRLDSSKDVLPFPLLAQLLSQSSESHSSSSGGKRKGSGSQDGPRKRSEAICRNWNLGTCEGDTCRFGRRHNVCCECDGPHRAKERTECSSALNHRRQQQGTGTARSGRK